MSRTFDNSSREPGEDHLPLDDAYSWIKFVHLLAVFGFLASHGASVSVSFKLRKHGTATVKATFKSQSVSAKLRLR